MKEAVWRPWRSAVDVVIHGVPVAKIRARGVERDAARADLGVTGDETLIGTIANFRADKDYPNLLRAAQLALEDGHVVNGPTTFPARCYDVRVRSGYIEVRAARLT